MISGARRQAIAFTGFQSAPSTDLQQDAACTRWSPTLPGGTVWRSDIGVARINEVAYVGPRLVSVQANPFRVNNTATCHRHYILREA